MPNAFPWPDDGDAAFLAALEAPPPKPKPLPAMIGALAYAIHEHRKTYYNPEPVEARMCIDSARQLVAEFGLTNIGDQALSDSPTAMGMVVSIDPTIPFGEVRMWPTPDEWAVTAFVARNIQ